MPKINAFCGPNDDQGFKQDLLTKSGKVQIIFGVGSIVCGLILEITSLSIPCQIYCRRVYLSQVGYGIWCGLAFVSSGFFGILNARKSSRCSVVALMTVSVSTSVFALCQIFLSILSMTHDRSTYLIDPEKYSDRFDAPYFRSDYAPVFIPNLILVLIGSLSFLLFLVIAALSCAATCCRRHPSYLQINLFQPSSRPFSSSAPLLLNNEDQALSSPASMEDSGSMRQAILMPGDHRHFASPSQDQYQTIRLFPVSPNN